MARTKQTARKNTGGKPLAMGQEEKTQRPNRNQSRGEVTERSLLNILQTKKSLSKGVPQARRR